MIRKISSAMLKRIYIGIVLSAFLAAAFISCAAFSGDEYPFLKLSGSWKLIEGGAMAPADPRYDDSAAKEVVIPGSWDSVLEKNEDLTSTIWLRKKATIGEEFTDRMLVLSLGPIALSDEVYINGVFIGSTGDFPSREKPLDYTFSLHRERTYYIPPGLVRFGRENVIAIKVFSHFVNGIRDDPKLYRMTDWTGVTRYREYTPSFNNLNPILLSIILLVFLVIVVKGSGNRYIGIYAALFIASVFIINLLLLGLPKMDNNLLRFKLFLGIYAFVDYALLLLIQEFFNLKSRIMTIIFTVLLAAVSVLIICAPTTRFTISYGGSMSIVLVIIYILYAVGVFITALYRDPRRYWYLTIVAVFILVSVSNMLYILISGQMYRMSFSFALRLPAILLGALSVYLFDLKNIKKERDSLALALMNKTKQLQRARKDLARTDVKPEPRDIIHDLIEYLDNNFNETYDRVKLAERFGLNEDYMGQLFKKVTSTNIANYINMKRIEAAKQLLQETDSKVIDIAFHVGFDNLTYFYRHFKKHTGYSPIEYKRMMRDSLIGRDFSAEDEVY